MSEILHYSIIRASGTLPSSILPPGISEPFAPRFRPVHLRYRRKTKSKLLAVLRPPLGRLLLRLGAISLRLGQRWSSPLGSATGTPALRAVR